MSTDDALKAALQEVSVIAATMQSEKRMKEALELSMRALEVRKEHYGVGSPEFAEGRIDVAQMVLNVAEVHSAQGLYREAADLLAHVDSLTTHPVAFPVIDRSRLTLRIAMMKQLMVARFNQQRHRSAITFGQHLLDLCRQMCAVYELPRIHLNMASIYSSMKQHTDALAQCYIAYQWVCRLLDCVVHPEQHAFLAKVLSMEVADAEGRTQDAYQLFQECSEMAFPEVESNFSHPDSLTSVTQMLPSSLTLLHRSTVSFATAFPCLTVLMEEQTIADGAKPVGATVAGQQRWGGMLALVYRNIGVEQEHTQQFSTALLTYRVAYSTAAQLLGRDHPVAAQCLGTLKEAEDSCRKREQSRSFLAPHMLSADHVKTRPHTVQGNLGATQNSTMMNSTMQSNASMRSTQSRSNKFQDSKLHASLQYIANRSKLPQQQTRPPRMKPVASHLIGKRRKERPQWNPWFNLKELPLRLQKKFDPEAYVESVSEKKMREVNDPSPTPETRGGYSAQTTPSTQWSHATLPPLNASGASQGTAPERGSRRRHKHTGSRTADYSSATFDDVPMVSGDAVEEEMDARDYAYLAQTFGLRYDPLYSSLEESVATRVSTPALNTTTGSRGKGGGRTTPMSNTTARQDRDLDAHRAHADKLAKEMGIR